VKQLAGVLQAKATKVERKAHIILWRDENEEGIFYKAAVASDKLVHTIPKDFSLESGTDRNSWCMRDRVIGDL